MAKSQKIPGYEKRVCDPVNIITQNIVRIIIFGTLTLLLLIPLAYLKQSPYYEAKGQIRISPVVPAFLRPMEDLSITGYYHDYLRTELQRLQDASLLETILKQSGDELKSLEIPTNKVSMETWYRNHISVKQVPRTQLLEVTAVNNKHEKLSLLVNYILDVYLEKNTGEEESKDQSRIVYLNKVKSELNDTREDLQNKLQAMALEMRTGTFQQGYWYRREWLAETQKALARAETALIKSTAELNKVKTENSELLKVDISGIIENRLSRDNSIWNTEFWTYRQVQNMRSSIDGITETNPDRIYIDERMKNAKEYLNEVKTKSKHRTEKIEKKLREIKAIERVIDAESNLTREKEVVEKLKAESLLLEKEAGESAQKMILARNLQKELEHLSEMEFRLNERIHELKLDTKAPDRVSIEKYAIDNKNIAGTNFKKLMILCALISYVIYMAYYFIKELRDDRIKSPLHIEMACGKLPSWPISASSHKSIKFEDLVLKGCSEVSARAMRSLGYRVLRMKKSKQSIKICFSGVHKSSGVTSIALNVAQTVSKSSQKTVFISHNENNDIKKYVKKAKKLPYTLPKGFRGVYDPVRKIDFIWSINKDQVHIEKVLKKVKTLDSFIFLDCDPLLISEKTEAAAGASDVNVLVARGDITNYSIFRRSYEILWRLGTKQFIPILNWGG